MPGPDPSTTQMGTDSRTSVLPVNPASGPGFLGPTYSPADQMLPPSAIGVHRGDSLDSVLGAVKGVIYYGDMIGFGSPSSSFTQGLPGLNPLGVNYFINSGLQCSNGATMWEYVQTIPTGNALGSTIKNALAGAGLPGLKGMAPGIIEDAESALNPAPVINAVVGSGYPQCRLVRMKVGDYDGKIQNVDGNLLVDPEGLMVDSNRVYYQEHWIQDRVVPPTRRDGETTSEQYLRGDPIELSYDAWSATPKLFKDNGCLDPSGSAAADTLQPYFCSAAARSSVQRITLGDGTQVNAYGIPSSNAVQTLEAFQNYGVTFKAKPTAGVSLAVAAISLICLAAFLVIHPKTR